MQSKVGTYLILIEINWAENELDKEIGMIWKNGQKFVWNKII